MKDFDITIAMSNGVKSAELPIWYLLQNKDISYAEILDEFEIYGTNLVFIWHTVYLQDYEKFKNFIKVLSEQRKNRDNYDIKKSNDAMLILELLNYGTEPIKLSEKAVYKIELNRTWREICNSDFEKLRLFLAAVKSDKITKFRLQCFFKERNEESVKTMIEKMYIIMQGNI